MPSAYDVLAHPVEVETIVKKSRFIACLGKVNSRDEALKFVATVREKYPDASHHCSAFVAGPPQSGGAMGFDDDGEPGGTAGKPMLNVLQHKQIGNVVAVVARYFGGIKLGAGGLVRAYSGAVQAACDEVALVRCVPLVSAQIVCDYAQEQGVRHLLEQNQASLDQCLYTARVELLITLPESACHTFTTELQDYGRGSISVTWQDQE